MPEIELPQKFRSDSFMHATAKQRLSYPRCSPRNTELKRAKHFVF